MINAAFGNRESASTVIVVEMKHYTYVENLTSDLTQHPDSSYSVNYV